MQVKYQIQDEDGYYWPCDIYETGIDQYEIIAKTGILARQSCGSFTISELRKLREIGKLLEIKTR